MTFKQELARRRNFALFVLRGIKGRCDYLESTGIPCEELQQICEKMLTSIAMMYNREEKKWHTMEYRY